MQFLGADATRDRLPFAALVEALRAMFEQGCELPPRRQARAPCAAGVLPRRAAIFRVSFMGAEHSIPFRRSRLHRAYGDFRASGAASAPSCPGSFGLGQT